MIDTQLVELYQEHEAAEMDEKTLYIELMQALGGKEVQRERALGLVYELRDRSDAL